MIENPFNEPMNELDYDIISIEDEIRRRLARDSLLEYEKYVHPNYKASKFHTYLCDTIQDFILKETGHAIDILLLSVPPQFGKSMTVTETLPAWMLGKYPNRKWIIASYNTDFATSFGRKNKQKCEEFNSKIFPNFKLADNPCNNVEFETTMKGGVYSAGLLAGITGHSAYYVIIDDPIKTAEESMSDTHKAKIWEEYLYSVRSRMANGGKIIVIQTRWAEDDLIGRLLKEERNITYINIPCECDDEENDPLGRKIGEGLCPEIGKGTSWLQDFKQIYKTKNGSKAWYSLYQGRPVAEEGNLLKKEWWQYYECSYNELALPYTILSVDCAFKDGDENDFVAMQVWGKKGDNIYLIEALKEHLDFTDTLAAIRNFKSKYPEIMFVLIEDKANGTAVINVLSKEMVGVIPIKPEGGKVARANAVSPYIEAGYVHLPRFASFTSDFVAECSAFPYAAHDDQVDAMTQALNRMIYVDVSVVHPKHIVYKEWREDQYEDYENADDELKAELLKLWGYPLEYEGEDFVLW